MVNKKRDYFFCYVLASGMTLLIYRIGIDRGYLSLDATIISLMVGIIVGYGVEKIIKDLENL